MLVGADYNKIEWTFAGADLLEPNAFIGDTLLFVLAIYVALKIKKESNGHAFYKNWIRFFIVFGVSLFIGGLGHLMWNYWGVTGKFFSWYTSILAVFYIEQAMISIYPKKRIRLSLVNWSIFKLVLAIGGLTLMIWKADVETDISKGLIVPSINSAVGMILSLVILGWHYVKLGLGQFKLFWIGIAFLVPSAFLQFMKINMAQWFDRNDFSHVLLAVTFLFYLKGVLNINSKNGTKIPILVT